MKRFSFLSVVALALLMVTVASCGVPLGTTDGYYEEAPTRGNVYYGDPYYGGVNTVIVERDPYTGRYYQVSPGLYGGSVYGAPVYGYGRRGGYGNGRNYNRNYNNGQPRNTPRTYPQPQQQRPQPAPAPRPSSEQRREAKDAIFGRPRN